MSFFNPRTGTCLYLALTVVLSLHAQRGDLLIYHTFDDLKNNTPEDKGRYVYDDYKGQKNSRIIFKSEKNNKEKLELECSDIWGFMYDSSYFRIVKPGALYEENRPHDFPVRIVRGGNLFFYENGLAYLTALRYDRGVATVESSWCAFLSETLDGPMVIVPCSNSPGWVKDHIEEFFKTRPQYKALKDCIGGPKNFYYYHINDCVKKFPQE